jgi:hypothetical protein
MGVTLPADGLLLPKSPEISLCKVLLTSSFATAPNLTISGNDRPLRARLGLDGRVEREQRNGPESLEIRA